MFKLDPKAALSSNAVGVIQAAGVSEVDLGFCDAAAWQQCDLSGAVSLNI